MYNICLVRKELYDMTECVFTENNKKDIKSFEIKGHTGFDIEGQDVLCAAVSALVSHTIGAIHEFSGVACANLVDEDKPSVTFTLTDDTGEAHAQLFLKALASSLEDLEFKYPEKIKVEYKEI